MSKDSELEITVLYYRFEGAPVAFDCRLEGGVLRSPYMVDIGLEPKPPRLLVGGTTQESIEFREKNKPLLADDPLLDPFLLSRGCAGSWRFVEQDRDGVTVYQFEEVLWPIVGAIRGYRLKKSDYVPILKYWYPDYPDTARVTPWDQIDPGVNEIFGDLLSKILEKAGYVVTIKVAKPQYFYYPTVDHVTQQIYSADKKGTFLLDLFDVQKKAGTGFEVFPQKDLGGQRIIGFKVDVDIPSKRAHGGKVQLSFDFNFPEEDGFKLIPIEDLGKEETREKINNIVQDVQNQLAKELDPLALRVKDAVICLAQDKHSRSFDYTDNELLDFLYSRGGKKKYHSTSDKTRVRERLDLLSNIRFSYSVKVGKDTVGIEDIPYLILNPEGKPFVKRKGKKKQYNSIEIPQRYWNLFFQDKYVAQLNRKALLNSGKKYLLPKYLATQWRIGWMKYQGVYTWKLADILTEAAIAKPIPSNKPRFITDLHNQLKEMKRTGLLGNYRRLNEHRDPIEDRWRFEAHKELKQKLEGMGQAYKEKQRVAALRAEKRTLKLEADVVDLKEKTGGKNRKG